MLRNGFCAVKRGWAHPWWLSAYVACQLRHVGRDIDEEMIWIPMCMFFATSSDDSMDSAALPA
ncbi:hypothetical protein HR51_16965 [Burkholderia cepacia]|nr:hypothetical protein HR51_16965 [Burkholderia cepacia]